MSKARKSTRKNLASELRQDLVSGDWVAVATGRAKRPQFLRKPATFYQAPSSCLLRNLEKPLVLLSLDGVKKAKKKHPGGNLWKSDWWVVVVPNKYPAFGRGACSIFYQEGPYRWTEGVGHHEVVVTRDHDRSPAQMSEGEVELLLRSYQERYWALKNDICVEYVSIFHNHGHLAGATIYHPHSQIIALPVIPPDVARSLQGSAAYFHKHKSCVHCVTLKHEKKIKSRVVYENKFFLVLEPYASKTAFETRIFPKRHSPHFEEITPEERRHLASALRVTLGKIYKVLHNPDYNFFLHTAPTGDTDEFHHYHWHFEILPKTAIWAGFEIGTGIEISTVSPEEAAGFLRKLKV